MSAHINTLQPGAQRPSPREEVWYSSGSAPGRSHLYPCSSCVAASSMGCSWLGKIVLHQHNIFKLTQLRCSAEPDQLNIVTPPPSKKTTLIIKINLSIESTEQFSLHVALQNVLAPLLRSVITSLPPALFLCLQANLDDCLQTEEPLGYNKLHLCPGRLRLSACNSCSNMDDRTALFTKSQFAQLQDRLI